MRRLILLVMLAVTLPGRAFAQVERLSDADVKDLMESIDHRRDRFEDALDGQLKHATLRSATSEVDVSKYLDDFQANVKAMEERFKPGYAASNEVQTALRQGTDIDRFVRSQGPGMKGASEWDALASDFGRLATSYGTTFPLPEGAPVRLLGDTEVASAANTVAKQAGDLKKAIEKDSAAFAPADRTQAKDVAKQAVQLSNEAKELKSRVSGGKPSSGQARALVDRINSLNGYISSHTMPTASASLAGIKTTMGKITQSFGLPGM